MKTRRNIFIGAFLALILVLCVAGTKIVRLPRTTTFPSNTLFVASVGTGTANRVTYHIQAHDLARGLGPWITNIVGGSAFDDSNLVAATNAHFTRIGNLEATSNSIPTYVITNRNATVTITNLAASRQLGQANFDNDVVVANGDLSVPDSAFGIGWDGLFSVPTKNAVYDEFQNRQPLDAELTAWADYSTNVIGSTAQVLVDASSNALYAIETTRNAAVSNAAVAFGMTVSNALAALELTRNAAVSNALVTLSSNNVRVVAGSGGITVTPSGSGGVMTYTVNDDDAGGGGSGTMTTIRSNSTVVGTNLVAILTTNANVASPVEAQWSSNSGVATVSWQVKNLSGSGNIVASNSPTIFDGTFSDGTVNTGFDFVGATVTFDAASPAQFGAAVIHNGKVTFNRDIIIPWEPVVAGTEIKATNGPNQFVTLSSSPAWTFVPLSGSDSSNSVAVIVSVTQDSTGGYRPTLNGATLWINTNANQSSDVKIWVQNGATNASYDLSYDLNSPQTGQVLEFHEPSGSLTNVHKNSFVNQTLSGVGGANTNFTGLWTHEKVYINGGLTNVNFVAFMPGLSDRTYYLAYTLTNLTATSRQISFSSVTNRIQNMQQYHGLTLPITLTNNHTGELLVELSVTNAKISFLQYTNGF